MRRYVVVRTDRSKKDLILRELEAGRLRQGWGWKPEHDLRLLRQKLLRGVKLSDEEASVWRNRRLLDQEPDGLKPGDVVIVPNVPAQGRWVLAEVRGPYDFRILTDEASGISADYGHIVPVELFRDADRQPAVIEADNEYVDARLRASMRNLSRMWSVDSLAEPIERLLSAVRAGRDTVRVQPEAEKFHAFFDAVKQATWAAMQSRYKAAELEKLVHRLFTAVYRGGRVEHWGGAGERGADIIVYTIDPLGLEYKIGVQVKMHDGVHDDGHALEQLRLARSVHRIDAGVIVTTAERTSDSFEDRRAGLEAELGIDLKVIARDELILLVMKHLGADPNP